MARNFNGGYGWRPDKPDVRDEYASFARPKVLRRLTLPSTVDLRPFCPPVYDQGQIGSCTANAIGAAIEFDQRKQKLREFVPSRLFIYYNERVIEGTVASDAGAEIRDGIKSVNELGTPSEKLWKYVETKFATKPTKAAYTNAAKHPAVSYERVCQSVTDMRTVLAQGYPIVFGFTVYNSFESDVVATTGTVAMPTPSDATVGGHAVLMVGYNHDDSTFLIRNSWGESWGMGGYFTLPYDYVSNSDLAHDFWTIRSVK